MDRDSFVTMDVDVAMGGAGDGDGNSSSGRGAHEEKFRVYNDALLHAAACQEAHCQAHNGRCHKVKASIDHFVRCYGPRRKVSPIERCARFALLYVCDYTAQALALSR